MAGYGDPLPAEFSEWDTMKGDLRFLGRASTAILDDVPCASEYAIDLAIDHQRVSASWNPQAATQTTGLNVASLYEVFITNSACRQLLSFTGEGGGTRWNTRCVVDESMASGFEKQCEGRVLGPTSADIRCAICAHSLVPYCA